MGYRLIVWTHLPYTLTRKATPVNATYKTLPSGTIVERYRIIGTDHFEYVALRPTVGGRFAGYSSFSRAEGTLCGVVGTEDLPDDLDALPPCSEERIAAVTAWQNQRSQEARDAISEAFPEAKSCGTPAGHGYSLTISQSLIALGRSIAEAVAQGDSARLESLCLSGGTYAQVRKAALFAGVSPERLEESLEEIS